MRPAVLAHAPFRTYLAGAVFGLTAMWMLRVTLGWMAWDMTGSAAFTGMVAFLGFAPVMISGPLFGVVADRMDPRRGIVVTQTLQAALAALLLALLAAGALGPEALAAIALAIGATASAYHPMRMSLAPRLVPQAALPQAVALASLNFNVTRMGGPALGGWLIATHGAGAALGAAAALFAPQIASMLFIPPQEAGRRKGGGASFLAELAEGARFAADNRAIREAMIVTGVFALAGRGALELLPVVADGLFGRGAAGLGALTAAAGAGAALASVWLAARPGIDAPAMRRRADAGAYAGLALAALLGAAPGWWWALAAVAGMGFCGTVVGVSNQSVAQLEASNEVRGRVMSLWIVLGIGGAALGAVALGAAADAVGLRAALVTGAAATAALLALGRKRR